MSEDNTIKIQAEIEKAKQAKIKADKKLAMLKKRIESLATKSKLELIDKIMVNSELVEYLKSSSIDQALLNDVLKNYEK